MNEEKDLKHKTATMAVLMFSLSMIASARAGMIRILDCVPEGAINRFYLTKAKENRDFCTNIRDSPLTTSKDLHDSITSVHMFSQTDHISSQMVTFLHKHLYIM